MSRLSRRQFLGTTLAGAAAGLTGCAEKATSIVQAPMQEEPAPWRRSRILGANDKVRVAICGFNGRGMSHISAFSRMDDVEVAYLVDPDTRVWEKGAHDAETKSKSQQRPKLIKDVREVLDDKSIDAITIATPNHWHSLLTIWACQADKHVYVEKPMCHNALEGQVAVAARQKFKKIVQHGTQQRSDEGWGACGGVAHSGKLGKLQLVQGSCFKGSIDNNGLSTRGDIGFAKNEEPPKELDFDIWLGPAPKQDYNQNFVPYRWHWFWDFGNGDIGNQGVHQMDVCHWVLPEGTKFPDSVVSAGGRFREKDQAQAPNSMVTLYMFGDVPVIFEVRGLPSEEYKGEKIGNILTFEHGELRGSTRAPLFYPRENGKIAEKGIPMPEIDFKKPDSEHAGKGDANFRNFINAIRADDKDKQNAPVERAFYPSVMCHLGNASYRTGGVAKYDKKGFAGQADADDALNRMAEYLAKNEVKIEDSSEYIVGKHLKLPNNQSWKTSDESANAILSGAKQYRDPFSLPGDLVAQL